MFDIINTSLLDVVNCLSLVLFSLARYMVFCKEGSCLEHARTEPEARHLSLAHDVYGVGERLRDLKLVVDPDQVRKGIGRPLVTPLLPPYLPPYLPYLKSNIAINNHTSTLLILIVGPVVQAGCVIMHWAGCGSYLDNGDKKEQNQRQRQLQQRSRRYVGIDDTHVLPPTTAFIAHFENLFTVRWPR